jgi:hypothetical protein
VVQSEQLSVVQVAFETVQVVFKELTKLADCADEFSSLNRAAGVWLYFIGGYFPVLLHCPSVMANSVYDISEVGEDARVKLFRKQEQVL